jgi:hypothetical protein
VELEWIIWRTSKGFVFGNAYNTVLATKPAFPAGLSLGDPDSSSPHWKVRIAPLARVTDWTRRSARVI